MVLPHSKPVIFNKQLMGKLYTKYGIQAIGAIGVLALLAFIIGFMAFGDPSRDFMPMAKLISGIAVTIFNVSGNAPNELP